MTDELEGWVTTRARLPWGRGRCHWASKTIILDDRLNTVEERITFAHELIHAKRGPYPACFHMREESAVEQELARLMIKLPQLADTLKWTRYLTEAADELRVTPDLLQVRLEHLHPTEQAWLKEQLGDD